MPSDEGCGFKGHCCDCGTNFEIFDYAGTSSLGTTGIRCPGCRRIIYKVKRCRR